MKRFQKFNLLVLIVTVVLVTFSSCYKNFPCHSCSKLCNSSIKDFEIPEKSISFITGKNYFVKNTYDNQEVQTLKIETQEQFEKIFGPATLMGGNGVPTEINFDTQFIIAIVDTISSYKEICMQPMYLVYENDDLVLHYQKTIGEDMTSTMRNKIISIVDKKFAGNVKSEVHL